MPRKTTAQHIAEREKEHIDATLRFLHDSDSWPAWPSLPMKKEVPGQNWPQLGVCYATVAGPVKPIVYLGNMFELAKKRLEEMSKVEYDSLEAMVQDGWRVD